MPCVLGDACDFDTVVRDLAPEGNLVGQYSQCENCFGHFQKSPAALVHKAHATADPLGIWLCF